MENDELINSGNKIIQYVYRVKKEVDQDFLDKNYLEKPKKELFINYKQVKSDTLIDYKYQIRVKDNVYIIYFDYL